MQTLQLNVGRMISRRPMYGRYAVPMDLFSAHKTAVCGWEELMQKLFKQSLDVDHRKKVCISNYQRQGLAA